MAAVELENLRLYFSLSRGWGRNRAVSEIIAVDDITLNVENGEAVASLYFGQFNGNAWMIISS